MEEKHKGWASWKQGAFKITRTGQPATGCSGRSLLLSLIIAVLFTAPGTGFAQITLNVGTHILPIETATTAPIQISINNPGSAIQVGSLDFYLEVEANGPKIKTVDLLNGTIFEFNHTGPFPSGGNTDHLQYFGLTRNFSMAAPFLPTSSSLVASITFDTLGTVPGQYDLNLSVSGFGDTDYFDPSGNPLLINILNGTLTVVPEPRHYGFAVGLGLLGLAAGRRAVRRLGSISVRSPSAVRAEVCQMERRF